jgi:hypothetical protein
MTNRSQNYTLIAWAILHYKHSATIKNASMSDTLLRVHYLELTQAPPRKSWSSTSTWTSTGKSAPRCVGISD